MAVLRFATHLWFDRDAVAAAELYTGLLPDSRIERVVATPPGIPDGTEGDPFIVDVVLAGQHYTFLNGGPRFPFDAQVSLYAVVETQEEVDRLWSSLLEGGGREVRCGWLTDRFGLSWQIVPNRLIELMSDPDGLRVARVMGAMMQMKKIVIADLEAAAAG